MADKAEVFKPAFFAAGRQAYTMNIPLIIFLE